MSQAEEDLNNNNNLEKSVLIKNNPEPYYHWAIDFMIQNKMYKEIKEYFLKSGYMVDFLSQKKNENKNKYINLLLKTNFGKENMLSSCCICTFSILYLHEILEVKHIIIFHK